MAFEQFNLTGKVALVTGGNSGIGLGMAMGLADAGADVCVWGTNGGKNAAAGFAPKVHPESKVPHSDPEIIEIIDLTNLPALTPFAGP